MGLPTGGGWVPLDIADAYSGGFSHTGNLLNLSTVQSAPGEWAVTFDRKSGAPSGFDTGASILFDPVNVFGSALSPGDMVELAVSVEYMAGIGLSWRVYGGVLLADDATYPTNARGMLAGTRAAAPSGGFNYPRASTIVAGDSEKHSGSSYTWHPADGDLHMQVSSMIPSSDAPYAFTVVDVPSGEANPFRGPEAADLPIPPSGGVNDRRIVVLLDCNSGGYTTGPMTLTMTAAARVIQSPF